MTPTPGSTAERLMVNAQLLWDEGRVGMANDVEAGARALAASQEWVRELEAGIRTALHMIGNSDFLPARKHLRSVLRASDPPGEEGT